MILQKNSSSKKKFTCLHDAIFVAHSVLENRLVSFLILVMILMLKMNTTIGNRGKSFKNKLLKRWMKPT